MWKSIGNRQVPVVLNHWRFPTVSFSVLGDKIKQISLLIIPKNFIEQVKASPLLQLGMIVNITSQLSDFYTGRIKQRNSDEVKKGAVLMRRRHY